MTLPLEEPLWEVPQNIDIQCTTFQIAGVSGSWLKGALIRFVKYHFSQEGFIRHPLLRCCVWDEDDEESKIWIGGSGQIDKDNAGKLPRIVVKDQGVNQQGVSFMNQAISGISPEGLVHGAGRQRQETGRIRFLVVAKGEDNTVALADELYETLTYWGPLLKTDLSLSSFQTLRRSEATRAPDNAFQQPDVYSCIVDTQWAYIRRWRLNRIGPMIKRVALTYSIFEEC
jgi:hypothetical protein